MAAPEHSDSRITTPRAGQFSVELSKDLMEAAVMIISHNSQKPLTIQEIRDALHRYRVSANIDEAALAMIANSAPINTKIIVARGTPPLAGTDGRIEYFFDHEHQGKPRVVDKGSADFKNIGFIINVAPGARLAKIHPPVPGVPGCTVTGQVLPAPAVRSVILEPGENTSWSATERQVIVADIQGAVSIKAGRIHVRPVMEIGSTIDYSTGNIDYTGSLVIKGDIKSGFAVTVGHDLVVEGIIEDAAVNAGGNILVAKGCVGTGRGRVKAGGSLYVSFAENQLLEAEKNVEAEEYLLNCIVHAGDSVIVEKKSGVIIGGTISAGKRIRAKKIGSQQGVHTSLAVGISEAMRKELAAIDETLARAAHQLEKVNTGFQLLKRIKIIKRKLPEDKKQMLKKLLDISQKIRKIEADAVDKKQRLRARIRQEDLLICAREIIHAGVSLSLGDIGYRVDADEESACFRYGEGGIDKSPAR